MNENNCDEKQQTFDDLLLQIWTEDDGLLRVDIVDYYLCSYVALAQ